MEIDENYVLKTDILNHVKSFNMINSKSMKLKNDNVLETHTLNINDFSVDIFNIANENLISFYNINIEFKINYKVRVFIDNTNVIYMRHHYDNKFFISNCIIKNINSVSKQSAEYKIILHDLQKELDIQKKVNILLELDNAGLDKFILFIQLCTNKNIVRNDIFELICSITGLPSKFKFDE
jgi:hypothetical protein